MACIGLRNCKRIWQSMTDQTTVSFGLHLVPFISSSAMFCNVYLCNSELQLYCCVRSGNKVTSLILCVADNNIVMVEQVRTRDYGSWEDFVTHSWFYFLFHSIS